MSIPSNSAKWTPEKAAEREAERQFAKQEKAQDTRSELQKYKDMQRKPEPQPYGMTESAKAVRKMFDDIKPSWKEAGGGALKPAEAAPFVRRMGEERRETRVWPMGEIGGATATQGGGSPTGIEVDVITELRLQSGELQGKMVTILALNVTDTDNWVKLLDTTPSDPQPCP